MKFTWLESTFVVLQGACTDIWYTWNVTEIRFVSFWQKVNSSKNTNTKNANSAFGTMA